MLTKTRSAMLHSTLLFLAALPLTKALTIIPRAPTTTKKIIVQMFEWTYGLVAAECGYSLGTSGVGFVQVSPAQENWNGGGVWWDSYQPESYNIAGKHGDRTSFANMVTTCHNNGVGVIVDTVMNHQDRRPKRLGQAMLETHPLNMSTLAPTSIRTFITRNVSFISVYSETSDCTLIFVLPGGSANGQVNNYDNATEVQFCELDGLADLATETECVRARLAEYLNDLISLGVDGLRLDSAKHIPVADISNITSRMSKTLYITQEVIYGAGEPITPNQYVVIGDVQEFRFTTTVLSAFSSGNIAQLQSVPLSGWVAPSGANSFVVTDHDTERNGNSLNYLSPNNEYTLAHIYSLTSPYGTPTILSSYTFSDINIEAPNSGYGACYGAGGVNGWLCQHRWTAIAGMIGFYNQVGSSTVVNWLSDASNHIAYGRGALGHVGINLASSSWTASFTTSLPSGTYCDVVHGSISGTTCSGAIITVSNGAFTTTVNAYDGFGIHTGAKIS
ncbi:hypothetical protein FRB93_000782 [Tulasnella sp. JGI-2019a]|nr:hypothetical protein FRB93_000782 [Tulasnella sp. JGI-2019a]